MNSLPLSRERSPSPPIGSGNRERKSPIRMKLKNDTTTVIREVQNIFRRQPRRGSVTSPRLPTKMNRSSSANERSLVKYSADLSTLNQLDTKDSLLSFPFDHIYACHSQSSDRRQPLHLAKEIEISTELGALEEDTSPEEAKLTEQLAVAENSNKKLKDLLLFHLDLIQQQNEQINKKDKLYNALKQENDTIKTRLMHYQNQYNNTPPRPLPTSTITSTIIKPEPGTSQIILNSFRELLPDRGSSLLSDQNKPMPDLFGIARTTVEPEVPSFKATDMKAPPALDKKLNSVNFKMIDNKRSLVKKEVKTENRSEALYTVTSNSGNPIIQRIHKNRRRNTNIGSLSRMSKTPKAPVAETVTSQSILNQPVQSFDRTYSINKKSKMINTYGKSRNSTTIPKRTTQFTGSLSDRLQLIDTTPTGEDPYQLGEADMREQSPIPKLMLQKTNHGRMKICSDSMGRTYDMTDTKAKINRFMSVYEKPKKEEKTLIVHDPDLDMIKTETEIAWPNLYNDKPNETSLCDFSYGEASMPSMDATDFQDIMFSAGFDFENLNQFDDPPDKMVPVKTTKCGRTNSFTVSEGDTVNSKRGVGSRRGRKRAYSTTGLGKSQAQKGTPRAKSVRGRGGAAARGKRSPVPGVITQKPYHTLVGDPDTSWYSNLDPDVKQEDQDPLAFDQASTVEVPRWREKHYTSCYTLEGTENLDDKVFEKRHQKLEAEERRQLRWHMRRVREQRHVEKLRQRQRRDSWCTSPLNPPPVYTLWNRPQQDLQFIEITPDLPVMAFGEPLPQLPETCFKLSWVRTSKAQKRSKRSKTMH